MEGTKIIGGRRWAKSPCAECAHHICTTEGPGSVEEKPHSLLRLTQLIWAN